MAWQQPKTDWQAKYNDAGEYIGDFINILDYNRIVGNLQELKSQYLSYNKTSPSYEAFKTLTIESLAHAEEWNIIERNLEELIRGFGGLNDLLGNMKQYTDNGRVIGYDELNRIESVVLKINKLLPIEYENEKQLQYSLGLDNIGIFSTRANGVI